MPQSFFDWDEKDTKKKQPEKKQKKPKKKKKKKEEAPKLSLAEQMLEMDAQLERLQARSVPEPSLAEQMADVERQIASLPPLLDAEISMPPMPPPPVQTDDEVLALVHEKLFDSLPLKKMKI